MFIFYIENRRHIKSDDLTLERDMSETHNITPIWFADPDATDHARVGGKGANLGRLTGAGFVVPPASWCPLILTTRTSKS